MDKSDDFKNFARECNAEFLCRFEQETKDIETENAKRLKELLDIETENAKSFIEEILPPKRFDLQLDKWEKEKASDLKYYKDFFERKLPQDLNEIIEKYKNDQYDEIIEKYKNDQHMTPELELILIFMCNFQKTISD
jgi:hypothetical protein